MPSELREAVVPASFVLNVRFRRVTPLAHDPLLEQPLQAPVQWTRVHADLPAGGLLHRLHDAVPVQLPLVERQQDVKDRRLEGKESLHLVLLMCSGLQWAPDRD